MKLDFQKLRYGKQYGYEVLFKNQDSHASGKTGVIIAEMGLPEIYEAEFYNNFMEHVFRYILPSFLVKMILADKGIGLIDPENPLAREEFTPKQLIDSNGSWNNRAGTPYVQCSFRWKPANPKNPWDHGYFLYTGDGPNGMPDVCDKVGAKVVGWYYGKLIPEKRVSWRSQLRKIYNEAIEQLAQKFPATQFRNAYYMKPQTIQAAIDDLIAAGCQTIVYQGLNCPLYSDFEDYGYVLPMLHQFARGRARVIMADQLGNQPAYRQAYFWMLKDQLEKIPVDQRVLIILSRHGHPFKKETQDARAGLYRQPLEEGVRRILEQWGGKWELIWSFDEYADPYWDKSHTKTETYSAYRKAIEEGFDLALELPTEFPAENTDLMIFHAIKKFNAFKSYDRNQPIPYPDWETPLVRKFSEGKTTGIYCGTPVGPYRKHIVQAVVDSISEVIRP
jgi:protoheme ferro-lyase